MAATAAAPAGGGEVLAALRRAPWWGVLALVLLAHWQLAERLPDWLGDDRLGSGAADRAPARIDVAFVRTLTAAPPPAVPPPVGVAAPAHLPAVAKRPAAAASRPAAVRA